MTGRHRMHDGKRHTDVHVPTSGGENVMVPVIRCVVVDAATRRTILLQRRAEAGEPVEGLFELPGGRWRAGESPIDAIRREVREETGVELTSIGGVTIDRLDDHRAIATVKPVAVIAGVDGAFPAIHVVLRAEGRGTPRPAPGETCDVRWWDLADVRAVMERDVAAFIPSSLRALQAYFEAAGSGAAGNAV